ncbi:MAG: CPBP family intramembrane metalloprotease [Clostridia bacterium]|nr:CPBP family intramembrane metalloprotease [Clostridia bacterium]
MQNNFYNSDPYNFNNGMPYFNFYEITHKAKADLKRLSIRIGVCILVFLSAPYILGLMLNLSGTYDLYLNNSAFQFAVELLYSVIFLFLPFFLLYKTEKKDNRLLIESSFEKPQSPGVFFAAIGFGLMLCFCGDFISTWISAFFENLGITLTTTAEISIPTSGAPLLLFILSTAILPAAVEEFAMRAVTMQALRKYGDRFAIIMTALVFGLMHRNAVQGIFAFIAGVVFGYITIATKSVWTAVIVHSLNNGIYVIFNVVNETDPALFEKIYPIFLTAVFVIGLGCSVPFVMSSNRLKLAKAPVFPSAKDKLKSFLLTIPMIISIVWMLIYTLFVQI